MNASTEAITRGIVHRYFVRLVRKYTSMSVHFAVIEADYDTSTEGIPSGMFHRYFVGLLRKYASMSVLFAVIEAA